MADESRSDDMPPMGWLQKPDTAGAMAFRRHHEDLLRWHVKASTSMLYGGIVLPYHYDVLTVARNFLSASMPDIAVIMAQTACEIATEEVVSQLLRYRKLPATVEAWVRKRIERNSTLRSDALYDLYCAPSGDHLKQNQKALWDKYDTNVGVRNDIVHRGGHASEEQAKTSCEMADELFHHFEAVLARVTAA